MSPHPAFLLIDRTAALMCGVVAGIAIGLAFAPQINAGLGNTAPVVAAAAPTRGPSPAQAASPVLPTAPSGLARAVAENRPFRVGVFGDSFGDGLWAALYNQLPRREAFAVLRFSEQATGFTRYRQLNLQDRLAEQLAQGPVDVAVISFGANDTQGVWSKGKARALLSAGWKAEITQRVSAYVQALQAQGATVVWIGLPVMREPEYAAQISGMNRFYAALMAELGVAYVDTTTAAADAQGRYAAYLEGSDGTPFLARASDGIHMSGRGYQRLTAALATQLRAHARAARRGEAVPASLIPPPPVPVKPVLQTLIPVVRETSADSDAQLAPPASQAAPPATGLSPPATPVDTAANAPPQNPQ
jgi:uncharacterized protein